MTYRNKLPKFFLLKTIILVFLHRKGWIILSAQEEKMAKKTSNIDQICNPSLLFLIDQCLLKKKSCPS